jgi:glycosyltransferase involved in cell wall biosynthesis
MKRTSRIERLDRACKCIEAKQVILSTLPTPIGVLIAQHPAINHAVILRELRYLRARFEIYAASIRAPDRPAEKLSPEEKDEAERTFYVNPQGFGGAMSALLATFIARPARTTGAAVYAMRLSRFQPKQLFLNLAYVVQAAIVGQWMRRNRLTHLHTHYSSTVALFAQRMFGFGLSISFHGPDEFTDPVGFWIREKVAASVFVRAISNYARSQIMKSSATADWEKVEVAYMGVDPDVFTARPFRMSPAAIELICVGRLAPVKAQHVLLAALDLLVKRSNPVLLHVVGGGPDRADLERYAAEHGLEKHVIFHGFTPQDKLDALYRQADVFVLPSFAEGVPGVLMEAMAMEIPCVSTWIAGVPELIRDGVDGLLVAPSDIEGLANAIERLIRDADLRRRLGQAGRARVLDRFDLRKNSALLADVIQERIDGPNTSKRPVRSGRG